MEENHIVKHQLDWELNNIVRRESSIRLKYNDGSIFISCCGAHLTSPTVTHTNDDGTVFTDDLLPFETRYQELNHNRDVLVNVSIKGNDRFSTLYNVPIAPHPVMVNNGNIR